MARHCSAVCNNPVNVMRCRQTANFGRVMLQVLRLTLDTQTQLKWSNLAVIKSESGRVTVALKQEANTRDTVSEKEPNPLCRITAAFNVSCL